MANGGTTGPTGPTGATGATGPATGGGVTPPGGGNFGPFNPYYPMNAGGGSGGGSGPFNPYLPQGVVPFANNPTLYPGYPEPTLEQKLALPEPTQILKQYMAYAALGGFIPIPFVDIGALFAINYMMINAIAGYYGQSAQTVRGKQITFALLGGVLPQSLSVGLPGYVLRALPFIGPILGFVLEPGFAVLVTYGIGRAAIIGFKTSELQSKVPGQAVAEFYNAVSEAQSSPAFASYQQAVA